MKNTKRKILLVAVLLIVLFGVYTLFSHSVKEPVDEARVKVVVTIFPLYDMARVIGGDRILLTQLLPPGVEAHSFEPSPSDMVKIDEADLFVYAGPAMEPWADDIVHSGSGHDRLTLDASTGIEMMEDEDEAEHGGVDPHIWLDFDNTQHMASAIAAALSSISPEDAQYFQDNLSGYNQQLSDLDYKYSQGLSNCDSRIVVYGGHYAFGYLAKRYDLKYLAAQGLSPDAEPTPEDLIFLVDQIRGDNIKYVFYEELTSPKIAETIASETGAKLLLLNAAHNLSREDLDAGKTFYTVMENNLANLREGLGCR